MRKIEAIVRPEKIDEARRALEHVWISGMTVTEVKGHGRQKGHREIYRGAEYDIALVPKLKVEVVVPDPLAARVVDDLARWIRSGRIGDGKIFVTPVEDALQIRTGERGEAAL